MRVRAIPADPLCSMTKNLIAGYLSGLYHSEIGKKSNFSPNTCEISWGAAVFCYINWCNSNKVVKENQGRRGGG